MPRRQLNVLCHFDRREKSFSDPSHSVGMTFLDPPLIKPRFREDLLAALKAAEGRKTFPPVVTWSLIDRRRITLVPPNHWLLVRDDAPFRVKLCFEDGARAQHAQSVVVRDGHSACFPPRAADGDAELLVERLGIIDPQVTGAVRFLAINAA